MYRLSLVVAACMLCASVRADEPPAPRAASPRDPFSDVGRPSRRASPRDEVGAITRYPAREPAAEPPAKRPTSEKAKGLVEKNPKLVRSLIESLATYPCILEDDLSFLGVDLDKARWTVHYAALTNLGSAAVPELLKAVREPDPKIATAALAVLAFDYDHYNDFPTEQVLSSLVEAGETEANPSRPNLQFMVSIMILQEVEGALTANVSGEATKVLLTALRAQQSTPVMPGPVGVQ